MSDPDSGEEVNEVCRPNSRDSDGGEETGHDRNGTYAAGMRRKGRTEGEDESAVDGGEELGTLGLACKRVPGDAR